MTATPVIASAAKQLPFRPAGSPRCARDDSHPVIASAAKQSSQSNNRRSRCGNSVSLSKMLFNPLDRRATLAMTATPAFSIRWIAALRSR